MLLLQYCCLLRMINPDNISYLGETHMSEVIADITLVFVTSQVNINDPVSLLRFGATVNMWLRTPLCLQVYLPCFNIVRLFLRVCSSISWCDDNSHLDPFLYPSSLNTFQFWWQPPNGSNTRNPFLFITICLIT